MITAILHLYLSLIHDVPFIKKDSLYTFLTKRFQMFNFLMELIIFSKIHPNTFSTMHLHKYVLRYLKQDKEMAIQNRYHVRPKLL